MKPLILFLVMIVCAGCHTAKEGPAKGAVTARDGSSFERAIQIKAKNHGEGLDAEIAWLRRNLPGSHLAEGGKNVTGEDIIFLPHRTETSGRAVFSVYTMQLADGSVRDVFFDQSYYFGK